MKIKILLIFVVVTLLFIVFVDIASYNTAKHWNNLVELTEQRIKLHFGEWVFNDAACNAMSSEAYDILIRQSKEEIIHIVRNECAIYVGCALWFIVGVLAIFSVCAFL